MKKILVIQGHPDPTPGRYGRQLAEAYIRGAKHAGHEVDVVDVTHLEFPLLRSKQDYESGPVPSGLAAAHDKLLAAEHLVIFFPLWLGEMPALLKGFFEQVLRIEDMNTGGGKPLRGKSAHIVITMGMPAFIYRFFFRAHGLKNLERNILRFVGVRPIRNTLIGMIERKDPRMHERWLRSMDRFGGKGF